MRNIGQVLKRGERVDELLDRTDNLVASSTVFKRQSTTLRRSMCLQDAKWTAGVALIGVVIVGLLVYAIYDFTK